MLYPAPELPDDTPVENVRFATRIRKALHAAGIKTVGDAREVSDATLLSLPDFGSGSLSYLREALGLPSGFRYLVCDPFRGFIPSSAGRSKAC